MECSEGNHNNSDLKLCMLTEPDQNKKNIKEHQDADHQDNPNKHEVVLNHTYLGYDAQTDTTPQNSKTKTEGKTMARSIRLKYGDLQGIAHSNDKVWKVTLKRLNQLITKI